MKATLHTRVTPIALGITPSDLGPLTSVERAERLRQAARALTTIANELHPEKEKPRRWT